LTRSRHGSRTPFTDRTRRGARRRVAAERLLLAGAASVDVPAADAADVVATTARVVAAVLTVSVTLPTGAPRAAACARESPVGRDAFTGDAGTHSGRARRLADRVLDARPGAAHRTEQSLTVDRAGPAAARGERRAPGRGLQPQGTCARERRSQRAGTGRA